MAFNGSGSFSFPYSWTNDAANGIAITASRMDTQFDNATQGFDLCITRDGQGVASAQIPFPLGIATPGVQFPSPQVPSANANTLDDYVEGAWVPADSGGGGITITVNKAQYTKIGNVVNAYMDITYPATADVNPAAISGLPANDISGSVYVVPNFSIAGDLIEFFINSGTSTGFFGLAKNGSSITNAQLSSVRLRLNFQYFVS